ncbi:hypothetical protein GCM10023088_52000 [Actinomadura verrucosospora]
MAGSGRLRIALVSVMRLTVPASRPARRAPGPASQRQCDRLHGFTGPGAVAAVADRQAWNLLGEGLTAAGAIAAPEPVNPQMNQHFLPPDRGVGKPPLIVAVPALRPRSTPGAYGLARHGPSDDPHRGTAVDHSVHAHAGQVRKQHGHQFLDRHTGGARDHNGGYRPEPPDRDLPDQPPHGMCARASTHASSTLLGSLPSAIVSWIGTSNAAHANFEGDFTDPMSTATTRGPIVSDQTILSRSTARHPYGQGPRRRSVATVTVTVTVTVELIDRREFGLIRHHQLRLPTPPRLRRQPGLATEPVAHPPGEQPVMLRQAHEFAEQETGLTIRKLAHELY